MNWLIIGGGLVLTGLLGWFFFGPKRAGRVESMLGPLVTAPSDATQRISAGQMVTPCLSRKGSGSAAVYGSPTVALGG
jgi:hypothetical protein